MSSSSQEAPNNLLSNSSLYILDLLGEGPIQGFVVNSGAYGADPLTSTFYDNVPVRNLDGSYNFNVSGQGYGVSYTLGTTGQLPMPGFEYVENIIPLSSDTQITYPPTGGGVPKNVTVTFNSNMYPDASSLRVTVRIPALYTVDNNGNINGFNVSYQINISVNGSAFTTLDTVFIQGKCTNPYLHSTTYALPKTAQSSSLYQWVVFIQKTDLDVLSVNTENSIFIDSVGVISASTFNYPNSVLVGTFIDADQFAQIPNRAFLMNGLQMSVPVGYTPTAYGTNADFVRDCNYDSGNRNIRVTSQIASQLSGIAIGMPVYGIGIPNNSVVSDYINNTGPVFGFGINNPPTSAQVDVPVIFQTNGVVPITPASYPIIWYGNFQSGVWTDNPAWIFYDILTNSRYGLGDFIQTEFVDKWTLYQIAQYCDQLVDNGQGNNGVEPRFSCNINLNQPQDAYNVLMNMASVFRGMIYYANGTIYTVQQDNKTPVYLYTNANVIKGQFSYADSARNTRSTVCQVRWNDPNNIYRQNTAYVEDTNGILRYGYVEKDLVAIGCTSPGQAYRLGQWALLAERILTETVTFQVGLEGLYIKPGDVFNVYDNFRNNLSQGGRITGFDSTRTYMYLDREVNIQSGLNYLFTAIIPSLTLDNTGDVTGSNQIPLIRNSQIQSVEITNTYLTSPTNIISLSSSMSTGLFVGSPWILSVTGGGNIFNNASIYQCLATTEAEPGIIDIVGLQYDTGILTLVEQNYNIVPTPPNSGDNSPISPPSDLTIVGVTGMFANSLFYYYLAITWLASPSSNLAYYSCSGQPYGGGWTNFSNPVATGTYFNTESTGQINFMVAAVSKGGVYSSFISGSYLIAASNPFGTPPLSGVYISADFDDSYLAPNGYFTGYVGTTPTFTWVIPTDVLGNSAGNYVYNSGWVVSITNFDGFTLYVDPNVLPSSITSYQIPEGLLYSLSTDGQRGFIFVVQIYDYFGNLVNGTSLNVNHPYPRAPVGSGFIGFAGGLIYSIQPDPRDQDISGTFLWTLTGLSTVPTDANYTYSSPGEVGFAINEIQSLYNVFYTLGDNFSELGSTIYGPVPLSPNDSITGYLLQLEQDISGAYNAVSGAFSQLTGMITEASIVASGNNELTITTVNGISGQLTGLPGAIQTALQATVNTAILSTSGVLVTQVNAVEALLTLSGVALDALVATVSTTLVNASGAVTNQINIVQANLVQTGVNINARQVLDETALVNSGAALTTSINQVEANVNSLSGFTTATISTVQATVASTGGALAQWLQDISVNTTGLTASINIVAQAFVTGGGGGLGGVAVATYGFRLDANGHVLSMQATAANAGGLVPTIGTIVFGGANLQSLNYVQGSAGWFLGYNGTFEGNNGVFRGDITGNYASSQQFSANANGLFLGVPGGDRIAIPAVGNNQHIVEAFNSNNYQTVNLGTVNFGSAQFGGQLGLNNYLGVQLVSASAEGVGSLQAGTCALTQGAASFPGTLWWTRAGLTLGGAGTEQSFNVTIPGGTFTTKPTIGVCTVDSDVAYKARYDYGASSSSTTAVVKVSRFDGGTVGSFEVFVDCMFGA